MLMIRAVHQVSRVPEPLEDHADAFKAFGSIASTLMAAGCPFRVTPQRGYAVDAPNGAAEYEPGDWMLFNRSGVYKVVPVPAKDLRPGDGILGLRTQHSADIWDGVFVLKYGAQVGGGAVRLVPDPDRCHPASLLFGVVYASPTDCMVWKLVD